MYNLKNYDNTLAESPFDVSAKLTFRVAGRALGLLSLVQERSITLKRKNSDLFYLDFFRALALMSDSINDHQPHKIKKCAELSNYLQRYMSDSLFTIAYRAALMCHLPNSRSENRENIRRCLQSVLDTSRNQANVLDVSYTSINNDIWGDFSDHLHHLTTKDKFNSPAVQSHSPFFKAWRMTARSLLQRSETWKVWIEWYDFRFLKKAGENVPGFLWKEIEAQICSDSVFLTSNDPVEVNARFAQVCLSCLEKLVDAQATVGSAPAGLNFQIEDDRITSTAFDSMGSKDDEIRRAAVGEVIFASDTMLDHCETNSARYLKPIIERYREAFTDEKTWGDDIELVMRGDTLRKAFESQVNKSYDSDLPDLSDEVMLSFRNLLRSHNTLVSLHENLWKLDEIVSASSNQRADSSQSGLASIIEFAETKKYLDENSRKAILLITDQFSPDREESLLLVKLTFLNFVQSASSFIWNKRKQLAAGMVSLMGAGYGVGAWMVANQTWLIETFPIDSTIGALVRAALDILSKLPLA
jgi:hypothetical protein